MCLKCKVGNSLKMYVNKSEPSFNERWRCVCKALLLPTVVHEHSDRLHIAETTKIIPKQIWPHLTFFRNNMWQKIWLWTSPEASPEAFVVSYMNTSTCNTCLGEKKEFVLSLLSIPHVISLKASRLAPCLRNTAHCWCIYFCSWHWSRKEKDYIFYWMNLEL